MKLAITDNMNFANPERPEIMGQFVGSVAGMGEACRALDYPVVSGNVSLYNETKGVGIPPTPAIGGVGLIPDWTKTATIALKADGNLLLLIGFEDGHLGQSLYQLLIAQKPEGAPPPVDLNAELKAGGLVRGLIRSGQAKAVHDCSDGGLLVAIAEMALSGGKGVELYPYEGKLPPFSSWFGEDQGRYVLEVSPAQASAITASARALGLPARVVGKVGGTAVALKGEAALPLDDLRHVHESWLPGLMGAK